MKANISEIFYSTQGEGKYIGVAQIFIRLSGCPFDCPYCDTDTLEKSSFKVNNNIYNNPVSVDELVNILIKEFGTGKSFHSYSITGGEPLQEYEFIYLLAKELKEKTTAKLFLETSGLITEYFNNLDGVFDIFSIDIKTHSKLVLNHLEVLLKSVSNLKYSDYYFKLLLPNDNGKEIIDYTAKILSNYNIKNLIVQPVDSIITQDILEYMYITYYKMGIEVRLIPQTHKFLAIP